MEIQDLIQYGSELDGSGRHRLAHEAKCLLGNVGNAMELAFCHVEVLINFALVSTRQVNEIADRLKRIVDFMSDAGRKPSRGREFLVSTKGFLGPQLRGNVLRDRGCAHNSAVFITERRD